MNCNRCNIGVIGKINLIDLNKTSDNTDIDDEIDGRYN